MIVAFAVAVAVNIRHNGIAFAVAVAVAVAVATAHRSYICLTKTSALDFPLALLASHLRAYELTTFAIMNTEM